MFLWIDRKNEKIKVINDELDKIRQRKAELDYEILNTKSKIKKIDEKLKRVRDESMPDTHIGLDAMLTNLLKEQGID